MALPSLGATGARFRMIAPGMRGCAPV